MFFPFKKETLAAGISITDVLIGVSHRNQFSITGAYGLGIRNERLSFGICLGVEMRNDKWTEVITTQEADPNFISDVSRISPQASVGAFYSDRKTILGFSINQILQRSDSSADQFKINANPIDYSYTAQFGRRFKLNSEYNIDVYYLIRKEDDVQLNWNIACAAEYLKKFEASLNYQHTEAIIAFIRVRAFKRAYLTYSFDYGISNLADFHKKSH